MDNIAEFLFRRRASNLPANALADLFGRLAWAMDDNGAEICKTLQQWIKSGDVERARVALLFDEAFLFHTREEMRTAFDRVCARFPELRTFCDERLAAWDAQFTHS